MKNISPWAWIPTLYFAEGLPYILVTGLSVVMFTAMGMSDTDIAFYTGWFGLPWAIKPFWSPFVDTLKTKRWWVLTMQMLMGAALAGIAFSLPTEMWLQCTICAFFIISFCSATHDIAADGFYMIELKEHEQAQFVGIRNTFYRLAVIFGNSILVLIAGVLSDIFPTAYAWSFVFYGVAALFILLWIFHLKFLPRPQADVKRENVFKSIGQMFVSFFTKFPVGQLLVALAFLLFFRFPEALLNTMSKTFLMRPQIDGGLGLTEQQFGIAYGTVGLFGLLLGGIVGGFLASTHGLKKWLWPMVLALTLPDLIYIYLSYTLDSNMLVVSSCLFVEQFGYGLGFTALTLYMLYFCQGAFKTSHYAICTGISFLGLMLPGIVSGWIKDAVGYQTFFIIVMISCAITFIVTALIKIDPQFGKKTK